MSRVGRKPVTVPKGVQIDVQGLTVKVKGPKGELSRTFVAPVTIGMEGAEGLVVTRPSDAPSVRALHGTTRALIQNMVTGVNQGFPKVLVVEGVGYRAEMKGKQLVMALGYSHPVPVDPPDGISFAVDEKTKTITISGIDKELVGQVAPTCAVGDRQSRIRARACATADERVRRKAGKAGKVG